MAMIPCAWLECQAESAFAVAVVGRPTRVLNACSDHTHDVHAAMVDTGAGTPLPAAATVEPEITDVDGRRVLVELASLAVLPEHQSTSLPKTHLIQELHRLRLTVLSCVYAARECTQPGTRTVTWTHASNPVRVLACDYHVSLITRALDVLVTFGDATWAQAPLGADVGALVLADTATLGRIARQWRLLASAEMAAALRVYNRQPHSPAEEMHDHAYRALTLQGGAHALASGGWRP